MFIDAEEATTFGASTNEEIKISESNTSLIILYVIVGVFAAVVVVGCTILLCKLNEYYYNITQV